MSEPLSETTAATPVDTASTRAPAGVGYTLVGSYPTVQVLSPTTIHNVAYCTIRTEPSGVVASMPVPEADFDKGKAGPALLTFAQAIEHVMAQPGVIAGVGSQTIAPTGLLADNVIFTVEYRDPVRAPYGAQAEATVPVRDLDFVDATLGAARRNGVLAATGAALTNLQAAAGG